MVETTSGQAIPQEILDDLSSRFIINVPEEERKDLVRICFQIELAHWFYLDFYCIDESRKLKSCGMKEFTMHIFKHIPFLQPHCKKLDSVLEQWRGYKQAVPTYGAILLSEDLNNVLLVQSYWAKASWGFPKGKVNEDENPVHCAVREVLEETGFDISRLIDEDEYVESTIHEQLVRLYIIAGVPHDTKFEPRTRNEIRSVEWFSVADLPSNKKDMTPRVKMGVGPNAFFMVVPFVKRLKRWIQEKQQKKVQSSRRTRIKSAGDVTEHQSRSKKGVVDCGENQLRSKKNTSDTVEPQQRNRKGAGATPDTRSKKLVQEQQFTMAIQAEVQELHAIRQRRALNESPACTQRSGRTRQHRPNSKRQLFVAEPQSPRIKKPSERNNHILVKPLMPMFSIPDFEAPCWRNFQFDHDVILHCFNT